LASLNRAEIAVWLVLWRDTKDGTARTSVADLARRAGCNRATVFRALRRLSDRGLVRIVYRGGLGRGPSRYPARPFGHDDLLVAWVRRRRVAFRAFSRLHPCDLSHKGP